MALLAQLAMQEQEELGKVMVQVELTPQVVMAFLLVLAGLQLQELLLQILVQVQEVGV
jgi:hypothetical protein